MRTKIASILAAGLMLASAGIAFGQNQHSHEGGSHWSIMGKEGHYGAQYRFELMHRDNNFASAKGAKAAKTTQLAITALNVQMDGRLNNSVTFDTNIHLIGTGAVNSKNPTDLVHWAYIDWEMSKMITIRGGRDFVNVGGWDNYNWGYYTNMLGSAYRGWNGLTLGAGTNDVLEVSLNTAGNVFSLQLVNDVIGSNNTTAKQPAMILEYKGDFGMVQPLVQIGQYDLNEDRFFTLGVKFNAAGFTGYLDYINDTQKVGNSETVATAINFRADYNLGTFAPFLELTTLDVKQDPNAKVNSTALPNANPDFDDNAMNWALGVVCNAGMGKHYSPFFMLKNESGKFIDSSDAGKEVTRSAMTIQAGVMGEF